MLVALHLFELKLLRADHLQETVDLRLLFLFQLLVDFAQAWVPSMVVRIPSCYRGVTSNALRACCGEVAKARSMIAAGKLAWTWEARVIEVEIHCNSRGATRSCPS